MKEIRQALDAHMASLNQKQRMAFKDKIEGMSEAQRANIAIEIMKMHPQFRDTVAKLQVGGIIPVPEQPGNIHQQTITSNYKPKENKSKKAIANNNRNTKNTKNHRKSKEVQIASSSESNEQPQGSPKVNIPYVVTDQPSNYIQGKEGELPRQWDYTKVGNYKPLSEIGLEHHYPVNEEYNVSPEVKKSTSYVVNPATLKTDSGLLESPSTNKQPIYPQLTIGQGAKLQELPLEMKELGLTRSDLVNMTINPEINSPSTNNQTLDFKNQEVINVERASLPLEMRELGLDQSDFINMMINSDINSPTTNRQPMFPEQRIGQEETQLVGDTDRGYVTQTLNPKSFTRAEISKMSVRTSDSRDSEGLEMLKASTPYGERIFVKNRKTGKWETDNWTWEQARKFAKQRNYKKGGIV